MSLRFLMSPMRTFAQRPGSKAMMFCRHCYESGGRALVSKRVSQRVSRKDILHVGVCK